LVKEEKLKEAGKTIPSVILPEGYNGKILLVSISGDGLDQMIILRSGLDPINSILIYKELL